MRSTAGRPRPIPELLRDMGLAPGSRVLIVSQTPERIQHGLGEAGFATAVADPRERLAPPAEPFHAAVLVDALERTEWDRWLLQQVRRALVPGGLAVLVARNVWSLASPGDAFDLAGRVTREISSRAGRRFASAPGGAPAEPRTFRGRKYRGPALRAMLERLGFVVERLDGGGLGRDWRVVARASDRGVLGGSVPLDACADHVAAYEREHAVFVRARDAWAVRHPAAVARKPETLVPAAYAGANVLVLAPHPDDDVIGSGGTLLRLAGAGARVACVQATDGSDGWALRDLPDGARRAVRMDEARAVARAAGFAELDCWEADNRAFTRTEALVERLGAMLVRLKPRLVFTPFLTDIHADHLMLNAILADAIPRAGDALRDCRVLGYEVWSLAPAGMVCDVTDVRERHEALLWTYESGMKVDDFVEMCERRNYYNACRLLGRAGYAEAFHASSAADYPRLVADAYQTSPTASV
jgi:LmbE family N-acetylglucosaminyl deacetylase